MTSPYSGQETAQAIDLGGAELHQLLAHAVQRQDRLLFFGLDCDRLDIRLLYRRPDGAGVMHVVLVAADEGTYRLGRHEFDLVTHRREFPGPVLRTAARFHTDQAGRPIGKVLQKLLALELHTHDLSGLLFNPVQLKHPLRRIHANYCFANIHVGPSGLPVKNFDSSTLGTSMPSAREGPPPYPSTTAELSTAPGAGGPSMTRGDRRGG